MKRHQRESTKAQYEAARNTRAAAEAKRVADEAKREASIAAALARQHTCDLFTKIPIARQTKAFFEIARVVQEEAPRLLDPDHIAALSWVATLPQVRPIAAWRPRGKGRSSLFRSLAEHTLAKYPVPAVLWTAFFDDNAAALTPLAGHVARGGSLYDYVKDGFTVPLTRKMCHEVLAVTAERSLLAAMRRVQVRAAGGDEGLFLAYLAGRQAQRIDTKENEAFWQTVIEWLAKQAMLAASEVGPLTDFIANRRQEDPTFQMKARSAAALMRAMHEWHGNLSKERGVKSTIFRASGLKNALFDEYARREGGHEIKEKWRVFEILSARALFDEGKRMGHCVYSYASRIEVGSTSIWSMTMEDGQGPTGHWGMATIEVRNDTRSIAQVRGRFNRQPTVRERQVLARWAGSNDLKIGAGAW